MTNISMKYRIWQKKLLPPEKAIAAKIRRDKCADLSLISSARLLRGKFLLLHDHNILYKIPTAGAAKGLPLFYIYLYLGRAPRHKTGRFCGGITEYNKQPTI